MSNATSNDTKHVFTIFKLPLVVTILGVLYMVVAMFSGGGHGRDPGTLGVVFFVVPIVSVFSSTIVCLTTLKGV